MYSGLGGVEAHQEGGKPAAAVTNAGELGLVSAGTDRGWRAWTLVHPPGRWSESIGARGGAGCQAHGRDAVVRRFPPVTIAPATPGGDPAAPTGQVFNAFQADNAFIMSNGQPANFLFATEDGTISGWNRGAGTQSIITVNEFIDPM